MSPVILSKDSPFSSAFTDIRQAWGMRAVWIELAIEDITDQHRRTRLGPAWLLLNYLAFAGTFVLIFRKGSTIPQFELYVAIGLFVWLYISEVVAQAISLFIREESFIKGTTLPLAVYVLKLTANLAIRGSYSLVGCLAFIFIYGTSPGTVWLWSLFALFLLISATPAVVTVLAMSGIFFPDLQFVTTHVLRLGIFLTPIFWLDTTGAGLRGLLYQWNPFTYFLEMVREPIYAGTVPWMSFGICLTIILFFWLTALILLGRYRKKIQFLL